MSHVNFHLGSLQSRVERTAAEFQSSGIIRKIWNNDHTVWRNEEIHKRSILTRLGWLHSAELMEKNLGMLHNFAEEIRSAGFTHAVVLGMGGSSLCPDVCRATFGSTPGFPQLLVLDSTNPVSVERIENSISLEKTLFIIASKSGGTTETNMFFKYFYDRVDQKRPGHAGENFVAVTDADTQMERIAKEKDFRRIFINPSDIGGRYSALSYFGLVPMAVVGMDLAKILKSARSVIESSEASDINTNQSAMLGVAMGEAFKEGVDKLTLLVSEEISTFGCWAEQLVAESTGKEGKGIVPIEGESPRPDYSLDRLFVFMVVEQDRGPIRELQHELTKKGKPVVEIILENAYDLGGEFFRWEFATAIAAAVMKINPFDEPNVKESKDNTVRVIEEYKKTGKLPEQKTIAEEKGLQCYCEPDYAQRLVSGGSESSPRNLIRAHLSQKMPGDYVALLAYVDQSETNQKLLKGVRDAVAKRTGCPTALGFGPRYLHSTGQLHKGGKANGLFILFTADESVDRAIPGEEFSFEVLKNAQALGDYRSLAGRSLRILRIHLGNDIEGGLKKFQSEL